MADQHFASAGQQRGAADGGEAGGAGVDCRGAGAEARGRVGGRGRLVHDGSIAGRIDRLVA